jgi:RNA polymerase sigma factor (sigma-70 family)
MSESDAMKELPDEVLLDGTSVDPDGFAEFYRRHAPMLLGYLMRRLGDAELAADVCAETFAAALAGVHRFDPSARPAVSWLYGIARHKLTDAQRRGAAETRARRRLGIPSLTLTDDAIERVEMLADLAAPVAAALCELPSAQRVAVRERVIAGRSYAEIARRQQTSEANVRQRVTRGLARLRARLGGVQ